MNDQRGEGGPSDAETTAELPVQAEAPNEFDEGITREPFEDDGDAP